MRYDGRNNDQMREITAEIGVLKNAVGSAMFRLGNTQAIAGVFGPKSIYPKHLEDPEKAVLRARYNMAPFSTSSRKRPGPGRREIEISKVTREALEPALILSDFPKTVIDIFIEIIQADASTRVAGINASSLALADAGVQMKDLVASCAAGKVDGEIVLDIAGKEDTNGEVDMPVAYIPKENLVTLLQMDGIVTLEEFKKIFRLALDGCMRVYEKQKEALKEKYSVEVIE